ncbi:hypothetical protein HG531_000862 [Fusarium graminearum]|nr:hypothetical protein HG531_000862 [Fusarium graminearum]
MTLGIEVNALKHIINHTKNVAQASLEFDLGSDVVDTELHSVDAEINTGIEVEQVENLCVEVDFGRDVLYFDRDLANRDIGVEVDIGFLVQRGNAAVGVFRLIDGRLIVAATVQFVAVVAIALCLCSSKACKRGQSQGTECCVMSHLVFVFVMFCSTKGV